MKQTTRPITSIPEPHAGRLERARATLRARRLDGYLITHRPDQYWLTGFTGEDGQVLLTARGVTLLSDGRFGETAEREAPWARRVLRKQRTPEPTVREIRQSRLTRLGFEPDHLSFRWHDALRKQAKPTRLVPCEGLIRDLRICKDDGEIEAIQAAIDVAEAAFLELEPRIRAGMTEREVAAQLVFEMTRRGASGPSFEPIVASGPNASLPHHEAGDRAIGAGEGVLIDWGARVGWHVSDLTRMVWPTSIPRALKTVYTVVKEAHDAAIAVVRPGVKASKVDRVARQIIRDAGHAFVHALGHGIGLEVHEAPRLGLKSDTTLEAGMVVTIEPGVYLPGVGGVRIESDVLIADGGARVLSTLPY